jgi:hypothetical protein
MFAAEAVVPAVELTAVVSWGPSVAVIVSLACWRA